MTPDPIAEPESIPNGSASAAMIAAGIGLCLFGVLVVLAEVSSGAAQALNLIDRVGPLSGKVAGGILAWWVSWAIFEKLWDGRQIRFGRVGRWPWRRSS